MKISTSEPIFGAAIGEREIKIHSPKECEGRSCPFHNPSKHKMKDWPMNVRLDNRSLIERICSHGVGHPDPDSVAYFKSIGIVYMDLHACCGCCANFRTEGMPDKELVG